MRQWKYPTAFTSWGEEERTAIDRVVRSGHFTMGEEVEAFEAELAAYHGVKHAVMVNSGSSANLIAVAALFHVDRHPLRPGDRVVVPALAWPTLYAPMVQHGLKLVVADVDDTWNASTQIMYPTSDCALFVGCSILGNAAHLEWMRGAADRAGAFFIEDNCESIGARHNGKLCGTFGKMGTLSFYWSHQLSAIEGGAVITDDDECALLCRMLRNHGWTRGTSRQPEGFAGGYHFELMGYNVRPLELHAAIAREQLRKLDAFTAERLKNAHYFDDCLTETAPEVVLAEPALGENDISNPFGLAFEVRSPAHRELLAVKLNDAGIDCRPPVGGSFTKHPYGRPWATQSTPRADLIHDCGIFIGNAPFPIHELIDTAVDVIRRTL